jgi:hypothetical protein
MRVLPITPKIPSDILGPDPVGQAELLARPRCIYTNMKGLGESAVHIAPAADDHAMPLGAGAGVVHERSWPSSRSQRLDVIRPASTAAAQSPPRLRRCHQNRWTRRTGMPFRGLASNAQLPLSGSCQSFQPLFCTLWAITPPPLPISGDGNPRNMSFLPRPSRPHEEWARAARG